LRSSTLRWDPPAPPFLFSAISGNLGSSRVISGHLGPAGTFFLFSAICAAGAAFVAACLPETKGRSLAEVQALFGSEAS